MPDGILQMSFMPIPSTKPQPQTNRSEHSFAHKIQIRFWVVGAILLLIGLVSYQSIQEFDETVDWAAHSQEILVRLQTVLSDVQDIEIGLRGYVMPNAWMSVGVLVDKSCWALVQTNSSGLSCGAYPGKRWTRCLLC